MECMIAYTPSDGALFSRLTTLVRLTLDAKVHDVVTTNRAVVNNNIPRPQGDRVPLFYFEAALRGHE